MPEAGPPAAPEPGGLGRPQPDGLTAPDPADAVQPEQDLLDTEDAGPAALRGGALRSAGYVVGLLLSLASAPLLIRHLGQEEFGRYVAVLAIVAVVAGFTEAGLNAIALREYATLRPAERQRLMADVLGLRVVLSLAGIVLGVTFAAVVGYGNVLVLGTFIASVGMLLQSFQAMLSVGLQGNLRFGLATFGDLLRQTITVLLIVALVFADGGVVAFLAVTIVAGLLGVGLTAWFVRDVMPLRPRFRTKTWWPLIKDTIPYAIAIALSAAYFRVAIVIMSLTATELQTGYFSTSFRVIEVLIGVPALVVGAAFPILTRAMRDDQARFAYAASRLLELGVIAGTAMGVAVGLGAGVAVDVLGGKAAAPAADVLRIQGLAMVATFVVVSCSYLLLSMRRNRALLVANAIALTSAIGLTFLLVPLYEAKGAAAAMVGAETALAASMILLLRRADRSLRLPIMIFPIAAAAAVGAVGTALLVTPHELIRAPVGLLVFIGLVALFGRFPPEVRDAFRRRRGA